MLVSAISKEEIYQISLPEKVKGQYWLYTGSVSKEKLVSIEGLNDEWILKSNSKYKILDAKNKPVKSVTLTSMSLLIVVNSEGEKTFVFAEPITEDRQVYNKYVFKDKTKLTIGRTADNDIAFNSKVVSGHHCVISYTNNQWKIEDVGSANGTFVNGRRVEKATLKFGDLVLVMGLKIILGKNFIALNNPDGRVKVTNKLAKFIPQPINPKADEEEEIEIEENYFYRSPRFKRDVETFQLKIDDPPQSPVSDEMPMILVLGTSVTMGMMSVVTLANGAASNNVMSMVMGGSMLLGTVFIPIVTKTYEKNHNYKKEKLRQKKYHKYLDDISVKIIEEGQKQKEILEENNSKLDEYEKRILEEKRNLWERSFGQNDFLKVRIGSGDVNLDIEIDAGEKRFNLDEDNLQEELYMLCERSKVIKDAPISFSLYDDPISGVIGDRKEIVSFAKNLIIQLASMYSYDEVKFVFLYNEEEKDEFEFVRWLPHVWSNDNSFRFIATSNNECKEVSAYLDKVIESRVNDKSSDVTSLPYYVIFSLDKDLGTRCEALKSILSLGNKINISFMSFYGELKNLPKESSMVIELNGKKGRLFDKDDIHGTSNEFNNDMILSQNPNTLSRLLSNLYLDLNESNYQLPSMITFLNLYGVGKIDHLNVLTRWKENDPTKSLAAAVGVDTLGDTFMLDLHEKFHGPHGLVAGMTGSGKSEFIITYILSLAINYHPEEVQFVMIDYKGGGMAKSFENLPHTVGIITNLDGAAIKRSLVSIESELKRRQAIFAEASKKVNISNIDIYKYQKLYREGKVNEPLSHLFIISDEFAELKTQQPEFMTQLISAARIGRSLGVHLILATQKPSGVVDDQIWSNSRFRVCLKVQEKADSQDMLKRPDAAELKETGRFYLQVGYNELFEMGQSAWSGAPYYPSDTIVSDKDESIKIIDNNGIVISSAAIQRRNSNSESLGKQVDEITKYLSIISRDEGISPRLLWLEPIKPIIIADEVRKKYKYKSKEFILNPLIGEYDDPANQRQCLLTLPISELGNTIVFGSAGSGKTTFLSTMIYSLINEHSPDEVNLYILDFASETLRAFSEAPHVGDVALAHEEEKINNLFSMLHKECEKRKKLFADYGGDYLSYINNSKKTIPSIVLIINNFASFSETYDDLDDEMSYISREGIKYGIYVVISASAVNNVRYRLMQNFNQNIVLQLNDETDYSSIIGRTDGLFPSKYKGRGLVKIDSLYEFQTANVTADSNVFNYLKDYSSFSKKTWKKDRAKSIPVLPKIVDEDYLSKNIKDKNKLDIPIGVDTSSLEIVNYDFTKHYINYILSSSNESQTLLRNLVSLISKNIKINGLVFDTGRTLQVKGKNFVVSSTEKDCKKNVKKLFDEVVYRNNTYKTALEKNKKIKPFDNKVIIIQSLESLNSVLDEETKEKLSLILEKGSVDYNLNIIIADSSNAVNSVSYENWFKTNFSNKDGIWIGDGITEQYHLKINNTTRDMREHILKNFGYVISDGETKKVKFLQS